jgi:hypothetical protein
MNTSKLLPKIIILSALLLFLGWEIILAQQNLTPDDLSLGSIDFPTSVSGEAQQEFLAGVLALHSFWYSEARDHFQRAQELDPTFAMAYWGEAMTYDHPIWEQHDQRSGAKVLDKLDQQVKESNISWSEREKGYVEAVQILYDNELSLEKRRQEYAGTMQKLSDRYPNDDEALAFAALAGMSVPSFNYSNPDVRDVVPIASDLENLYQRNPDHPGAMHYLIHVYDSEKFAEMGLRPALDYADIAYSSSHAIHMPSHIYKHLEMWDKVIESNIRAYEASVEWQQQTDRPLKDRDYHSYRWLFEAYLEVDSFEKACEIIHEMDRIKEQAQKNDEDLGRIPNLLVNFADQYENNAKENAPECTY